MTTESNSSDEPLLIWVDLEMSGLEIDSCHILEIASLVTDANLDVVATGPHLIIHQPDKLLDNMDEWNTEHHGRSGLVDACRKSTVTMDKAQRQTLEFLERHVDPRTSPLCGNSVDTDRRFLEKDMPKVAAHLHYRTVDVTSFKEMIRRWYGEEAVPPKKEAHRALDDILESLAELRHYRQFFRDVTSAS